MIKRVILSSFIISIMVILSGCCYSHEFEPATCTTAATCIKCGETQGEPLGHDWSPATCNDVTTCRICGATEGEPLGHNLTKATFQEAPVCKRCGETVGEPLTAGFVKHNIKIDSEKTNDDVEFETICYSDSTKKTVGKFSVKDFHIITDEKELEELEVEEGYLWASVNLHIEFSDQNAYDYGTTWSILDNDYYYIELFDDTIEEVEDNIETFTVNYMGKNWDKCMMITNSNKKDSADWVKDTFVVDYFVNIRLPENYDGYVFSALDSSVDSTDKKIYDLNCEDKQIANIKLPAFK